MGFQLGEYALSGAMLTSLAIVMAAFAYGQLKNEGLLRAMRAGHALLAGLLSISVVGLLRALVDDNFGLAYVVEHSQKALPLGYKLAALWAGQQGSLLFWAWVLGVMGAILAWRLRRKDNTAAAVSLAVMAAVTGFFTCVMLFANDAAGHEVGNPFQVADGRFKDGIGLNPQLQNLAMVFHPPLLFLGYAGFTVPFALLMGALFAGKGNAIVTGVGGEDASPRPAASGAIVLEYQSRQRIATLDERWLGLARPWMVFSWIMLTVGIVLGAQWAYMELGWGGYWAWDPVENASLLPWLTGTGLLHSAIQQTKRGMFKRWTAALTAVSFFLCIFGTYLTRSGVVQSVHAFGPSTIGTLFLVFLGAIAVSSVVFILLRLRALAGEHALESLISQEGFFLMGNILLVIMTGTTLVGTLFPLISSLFSAPITVNASFYNMVILPLALVLAALMSTGPVLGPGAGEWERSRSKIGLMAITGFVAAILVGLWDFKSIGALFGIWGAVLAHFAKVTWALIRLDKSPVPWDVGPEVAWLWMQVGTLVVMAVVTGVIVDIYTRLRGSRPLDETRTAAASSTVGDPDAVGVWQRLGRTLTLRHRHWGAQVAHLGLAAIIVGVAGSSVYGQSQEVTLRLNKQDKAARIGEYSLELTHVEEVQRANHSALVATVELRKGEESIEMKPEMRAFGGGMQGEKTYSKVALRPGIFSDLYLTFLGVDTDGSVGIKAMINPLVNWIWIGGGLLTLGGLICLIPVGRKAALVVETEGGRDAGGALHQEQARAAAGGFAEFHCD